MKSRIIKKKNTLNRAQYIADFIGTIERGIWVEYFKKHPTDLPKVLKRLSTQWYKSNLKRDVRTNYHNPRFNQKRCDWTIFQLENGYFGRYIKLNPFFRVSYGPQCIPLSKENPHGVNRRWRDGKIRSLGVSYESDN